MSFVVKVVVIIIGVLVQINVMVFEPHMNSSGEAAGQGF